MKKVIINEKDNVCVNLATGHKIALCDIKKGEKIFKYGFSIGTAKNDIAPERILMIGNSVKSDIAPVINLGGTAIHTPHEVVWVHEMMDMPESDRIIEVQNIKEILRYLL